MAKVLVCLILLAIVGIIIGINIPKEKRPETSQAFVERWAQALEKGDFGAYDSMWDEKARKKHGRNYKKAMELFTEHLEISLDSAEFIEKKENFCRVEAPVRVDKKLAFRSLEMKRKKAKWSIVNDRVRFAEQPKIASQSTQKEPQFIDGNAPLDTKLKISQVMGEWQVAWQEEDLDAYMSKYADDARITRVTVRNGKEYSRALTKRELRRHMKKLNRRYKATKVKIFNLKVDGNQATADVKFVQAFSGESEKEVLYHDRGTKTLTFMMDSDGYWKIYEEKWTMYVKVPEFPKL